MNKTLSINLNGLVFQIDELAYEKLSNYLKAISERFKNTESGQEIITDIEARIAEMFSEKLSNIKQVISMDDVDAVIETMGKPEDFDSSEEEILGEDFDTNEKKKSIPRKLFRDTENSVLGGVCSGISAYLGISDPIFLRLIFLIAFFGFGTGFLVYLILWIVIPEAKTASDKLHMRGEPINISNIEKTITEEFDDLKKSFSDSRSNKRRGSSLLKNIFALLLSLVTIFAKIIGLILIIGGSIVLMSIFTGSLTAIVASDVSLLTLSDYFFDNGFHKVSSLVVSVLLVFVPLLSLIYLGLQFVGGKRFRIRGFSKTMMGLFVVGLIGLASLSIYTASIFSKSSTGSTKVELDEPYNNTYYIQGNFAYGDTDGNIELLEMGDFTFKNKQLMLGDRAKLDVVKSMDNMAYLEIITKAKGSSREEAFKYQTSIDYGFEQKDSLLIFPYYFPINEQDKIRAQKIQMHLHLPVGARIFLDRSAEEIIYDIKNVTNTYDGDMLGHIWEMRHSGLTCIDCNGTQMNSVPQKSSAPLVSQSLEETFDEVEINGHFEVKIKKGDYQFKSEDDSDFSYSISGGKLTIKSKDSENFFNKKYELELQLPELRELELNSAAVAEISGFDNERMDIRISGANKCQIDINPQFLDLEINGAAKVDMNGSSEQLNLEINGASKLDGVGFKAQQAMVDIAGASKVELWVEESLDATVSGASVLNYKGLPEINSDVSGFSSIKPIQ